MLARKKKTMYKEHRQETVSCELLEWKQNICFCLETKKIVCSERIVIYFFFVSFSIKIEQAPPSKKFKFSFDTSSNDETNDETMIQMDFMSFLKKPCQNDEANLHELKLHPWVQKLFIKYNSIVSSSSALERSVPLSGEKSISLPNLLTRYAHLLSPGRLALGSL